MKSASISRRPMGGLTWALTLQPGNRHARNRAPQPRAHTWDADKAEPPVTERHLKLKKNGLAGLQRQERQRAPVLWPSLQPACKAHFVSVSNVTRDAQRRAALSRGPSLYVPMRLSPHSHCLAMNWRNSRTLALSLKEPSTLSPFVNEIRTSYLRKSPQPSHTEWRSRKRNASSMVANSFDPP